MEKTLLLLLLTLASGTALAADGEAAGGADDDAPAAAASKEGAPKGGPMGAVKEVCADDWAKACPDMKPGDGKFLPCVKEHREDFSQACQDAMQKGKQAMLGKMKGGRGGMSGPCKDDAAKLCPGMTPGDGKLGPCMKEHKDEVSDGCKKMMGRMMGGKKGRPTKADDDGGGPAGGDDDGGKPGGDE